MKAIGPKQRPPQRAREPPCEIERGDFRSPPVLERLAERPQIAACLELESLREAAVNRPSQVVG